MAYSYKGAITFGLVYIPITLEKCVRENDIGFNMIDKKTMSRIKYKKTCVDCKDREVKTDDIVKGYQYEKGKYVIFTDKDFDSLKSEKDKNIDIVEFVKLNEVDPIYFDTAYYVKPVGADKAFCVLLRAMEKENKAGLAKTVLGTKETLLLIRVKNGTMVANTLYFEDEILVSPNIKSLKTSKEEVDLAVTLIDKMSKSFEPEKYKDEYNEKVKKAIKRKIAGNEIVAPKEKSEPARILNIMDALKKSLESPSKKPGEKRKAK